MCKPNNCHCCCYDEFLAMVIIIILKGNALKLEQNRVAHSKYITLLHTPAKHIWANLSHSGMFSICPANLQKISDIWFSFAPTSVKYICDQIFEWSQIFLHCNQRHFILIYLTMMCAFKSRESFSSTLLKREFVQNHSTCGHQSIKSRRQSL